MYSRDFCAEVMKDDTMKFAGKWMGQEDIMLRDVTQYQKNKRKWNSPSVDATTKYLVVRETEQH